jgi:hypothetical protein
MTETTGDRLRRYVKQYHEEVWPDLREPEPTEADLISIEVRSDGYANAHVEGEHHTHEDYYCTQKGWNARECGERMAAAEFVECS